MSCIRIRNSFPFEWLCTRTRFETEACSNSEMGYWCPKIPSFVPRKRVASYPLQGQMLLVGPIKRTLKLIPNLRFSEPSIRHNNSSAHPKCIFIASFGRRNVLNYLFNEGDIYYVSGDLILLHHQAFIHSSQGWFLLDFSLILN